MEWNNKLKHEDDALVSSVFIIGMREEKNCQFPPIHTMVQGGEK